MKHVRMKGVTLNGEVVCLECPGCGRWPLRKSWLEPCGKCDHDTCRVCREEGCKCTGVTVAPPGGQ
jgi:hypothetical protein